MRAGLKILFIFCGLMFGVLALASSVAAPSPGDVARIHYHRADKLYEGWGLHLWGAAPSLATPVDWAMPLPPTGTDAFGVYFDVPLQAGAVALNFIVHKGSEKHVPDDQVLDFANQGREIWLIAGDAAIYTRPPALSDKSSDRISALRLAWARQPAWLGFALAGALLLLIVLGGLLRHSLRLRADIQRQSVLLAQSRKDLEVQAELQSEAHARVVSLVGTDELTGLMTRAGVRRALASAQAKARRNQTMLAVLFLDLDDFKPINDRYGHAVGDRVLVAVAERLQRGLRESDILARLGGDEFLIIAEDIGDPLVVAELARKLLGALAEVIEFEGNLLRVKASLGVALYPSDGEGDELIELADAAMYDAKRADDGGFRFASAWLNAQFQREVEVERLWREVLTAGSLALGWLPLRTEGGEDWAWVAQAFRRGDTGLEAMPVWSSLDPDLALEADLWMLEKLVAAVESSPGPGLRVIAPARSSLSDPRFLAACQGALTRMRERGATLVLELPHLSVVPDALRALVSGGGQFALRLSRPEQISLYCLAEPGLRYLLVSGLASAGPEDGRALTALFAGARALGIAVVFGPLFETSLPIHPDYRVGEPV
ncbi:diguanylate cyclase domain-containing protein [Niveibacterium terrae]|uniref:diguanylate cyclase domain-containing protein n=1 Tax=Niveibacterium terrae TaxID=3373598 RepID=UPI003A9017C6